jgi:predicted chitinase
MNINKDAFLFAYQQEEFGALSADQAAGLAQLLTFLQNDPDMTDVRWVAYCLATVQHECAGTWQPIAEYGKGKGRSYGNPDPTTGQTYYGRGYVQLTWKDNYAAFVKVTGADLVNKPNLAMQPNIAYKIMSYGMRHGSFTGVGLGKYIHDDVCDYVNARRIINGTDQAEKIAGYAQKFAAIMGQCTTA